VPKHVYGGAWRQLVPSGDEGIRQQHTSQLYCTVQSHGPECCSWSRTTAVDAIDECERTALGVACTCDGDIQCYAEHFDAEHFDDVHRKLCQVVACSPFNFRFRGKD